MLTLHLLIYFSCGYKKNQILCQTLFVFLNLDMGISSLGKTECKSTKTGVPSPRAAAHYWAATYSQLGCGPAHRFRYPPHSWAAKPQRLGTAVLGDQYFHYYR